MKKTLAVMETETLEVCSTGTSRATTGRDCASHQTRWTGIIARAMHLFATTTPAQTLALGKIAAVPR